MVYKVEPWELILAVPSCTQTIYFEKSHQAPVRVSFLSTFANDKPFISVGARVVGVKYYDSQKNIVLPFLLFTTRVYRQNYSLNLKVKNRLPIISVEESFAGFKRRVANFFVFFETMKL